MRWDILNELLEHTSEKRFLEIGVQAGKCGARIRAAEKWGVDPAPRRGTERGYDRFFRGTSDRFFEELDDGQLFDVVLVDGLHEANQVLRDTDNALAHLAPGGSVVLHDCNPRSEIAQRVPRETGVWNGDCWKAMVWLRQRDDVDAFTVDTDHGVGIVRPRPPEDRLSGAPEVLRYTHLTRDRERLLGLVSPERWAERLGGHFALGRIAIVTAIVGDRDDPVEVRPLDVDEWVMFTDGAQVPDGWRLERVSSSAHPRLVAREIKTLALEQVDADVVVWIDGRILPTGVPLRPLLRRALRTTDIAGFPHPWRTCAYAEAKECARLGRAPAADLEAQVEAYRAEGFPENFGLWNTMALARRRTESMIDFGRAWWAEIQTHTPRDQVSFPYLVWKHELEVGELGGDIYRGGASPHFHRGLHRGQRT